MPFDRRNIPMTDDLKKEISGAKNIFEVFYSMSRETPPGAYPLNTGEWIRGCQTLYPEFYQKAVEYGSKNYIRTGTNAQYEAELTSTGQSGMFVIEGSDIRLPKVTRYIRGYESNQAVNVHNKVYTSGLPDINLALRYDDWHPGPVLSAYGYNGHAVFGTGGDDECMIDISGVATINRSGDLIKDPAYTRYKNNAHGFANEVVAPCVTMALYIQVFNRAPIEGYANVKDVLDLIRNYTNQMDQKISELEQKMENRLASGVVGFPDYSRAAQLSGPNPLSGTASESGWLMIQNGWGNNYGMGACVLTIGNRTFTIGYNHNEGKHYSQGSTAGMFPVNQGETWSVNTRGTSYRAVYWIPCA